MVGNIDEKGVFGHIDILNRPLGGFAFMGLWVGFVEVLCCIMAFQSKDMFDECHPMEGNALTQVGIWNWLIIDCGFALMHLLFAPYVYLQLWRSLIAESKEPDDMVKGASTRTQENRRPGGAIIVSRHDVVEAFKDTFRGDPIIYLYAVVLVVDMVWSVVGLVWIHSHGAVCNPRGWTLYSAYAGFVYFIFVLGYAAAWYYYMEGMDKTDTITIRSGDSRIADYSSPQQAAQAAAKVEEAEVQQSGGFFCCASPATPSGGKTQALTAQSEQESNKPKIIKKPSVILAMPKLAACVTLDALGNTTYFVPGVGELGDIIFAPASAVMMKMLFDRNGIAMMNGAEEVLPGTDAMPTATLAWTLQTIFPNSRLTRFFGLQKYE